jgi:hypothetical protein
MQSAELFSAAFGTHLVTRFDEDTDGPGVGDDPAFPSGCNLRCVFCRNFDISWQVHGEPVTAGRLAAMMLTLQDRGCRNINLVTPVELSQDRQQDITPSRSLPDAACWTSPRASTQMRSGCCPITSPGPPRR